MKAEKTKMKTQRTITAIVLGIFLIGLASAIYPGETLVVEHPLGTDKLVWKIIDNTSELSVLPEITFNISHITITLKSEMPPNSFNILFTEENNTETANETIPEVVIYVSSGSGGHSHTSLCGNGICNTGENYKNCLKDCPIIIEENSNELINANNTEILYNLEGLLLNKTETKDTENSRNFLTGAVMGVFGKTSSIIIFSFIILLIIAMIVILLIKKNKKKQILN